MAKKLNVSVSTVSRALRNAADINPETREAVLRLAEESAMNPIILLKAWQIIKQESLG